jgi:broad specificity phosphatase PhoE
MAGRIGRGHAVSGRLVLVRHGQSLGNIERRLDTRPPGAALTELGREQARTFARGLVHAPVLVAHSVALRASQTAGEIADELGIATHELEGIHEVQVGALEDRTDDDAIKEFETVYQRWHQGDHEVSMPDGETARQVLDRYVPVITQLRMRHLDDDASHGDIVVVSHGAAIRLVSAVLAGVDSSFALDHHLGNAESVVLAPITDGRWSCLHWGPLAPPFYPESDVHPVEDALRSADPMG